MKITIKNVGQGDSIILEWKRNGEEHTGIIDCNRFGGINPVLEYLKQKDLQYLSFLILSHPHEDHFSGMLELLNYLEAENIKVNKFIHTLRVEPRHLNWAIVGSDGKQRLVKLIKKVGELYDQKKIIQKLYAESEWTNQLNDEWFIQSLGPSEDELNSYVKTVQVNKGVNELKCSKAANLLSSIFKIYSSEGKFIILTADAELDSFDRIIERNDSAFNGELLICQIPHHGSIKNHKKLFWSAFTKKDNAPAVISAGENSKYKHLDKKVIEDFVDAGFKVFSTNNVNGMRDFIDNLNNTIISSILDDDSEIVEEYNIEGDQIFEITNGVIN